MVVEEKKQVLGAEQSHTLNAMYQLAATYRDKGRLDDAEELLVLVIHQSKG